MRQQPEIDGINNGFVPSEKGNIDGGNSGGWQDMLMKVYMPGVESTMDYFFLEERELEAARPRGIFACPGGQFPYNLKVSSRHYGINKAYTGNHAHNGFASSMSSSGRSVSRLDRIRRPSQRAGLFDIDKFSSSYPESSALDRSQLVLDAETGVGEWRHLNKKGINVCYADGHVKGVLKDEIPKTSSDPDKDTGYFWVSYYGDEN